MARRKNNHGTMTFLTSQTVRNAVRDLSNRLDMTPSEMYRRFDELCAQETVLSSPNRILVGFDTSTGIDFTSIYGRIAATSTTVVDPSRIFVLTPDSTL